MSTRQMGRSIHKSTCLRRWPIITDHKYESDPPASGHPNQPDHKKYKRKRKYKHFSDKKPVGLEDEKTSLASRASNLFHLGLLASTTNFEIFIFFYISDYFMCGKLWQFLRCFTSLWYLSWNKSKYQRMRIRVSWVGQSTWFGGTCLYFSLL